MAGVAAVFTILSGVSSYQAGREQKKRAEAAAREQEQIALQNAANIEAETAEQVRRAGLEASKREGAARAKVAASGRGGTIDNVLLDMAGEHDRQLEWMRVAGKARASLARKGGEVAADATRAQGEAALASSYSNLFTSVGNTYQQGSSAGWWT